MKDLSRTNILEGVGNQQILDPQPVDIRHVYAKTVWEKRDADDRETSVVTSGPLLLFDVEETLRDRLQQQEEVLLIKPGSRFRKRSGGVYELRPERADDYQKLFAELQAAGAQPNRIVFRWSRPGRSLTNDALEEKLTRSIYALFHLSQALCRLKARESIRILHVYQSAAADEQPVEAAISAFSKTIAQETGFLQLKTLELRGEAVAAEADAVRRELTAWRDEEFEVCEAAGQQYVRRLQILSDVAPVHAELPLRKQGVYLITGGLGGLGLLFANYLAERYQAKLVLTGRSPLDEERQNALQALEAAGAEAIYLPADVAKKEDVEALVAAAHERFAALHGVIHSAGVLKDRFFLQKTEADLKAVLLPKVHGAIQLDLATADEQLDFFALFSSIAGTTGNVGQCDYAYANSFLDRFAAWRQGQPRAGKTVAIGWPLWEAGGMQIDEAERALREERTGLHPLPTAAGLQAWESALQTASPHLIVSYGQSDKIERWLLPDDRPSVASKAEAPSRVDSELLKERTEQFLRELFAEILKIQPDKLDQDASFQDYGINSIMIHQFNVKAEARFGPLSKTLLFESQTLNELTETMLKQHEQELIKGLGLGRKQASEAKVERSLWSDAEWGELRPLEEQLEPFASFGGGKIEQEEIAIIGISGRYPMASDLHEFWQNLQQGKDCITEVPASRWDVSRYYDPDPEQSKFGKMYSKWGGFLEDADKFDPLFFNISPKEAETMDPQERLFLEVAWAAMEDAGYTRKRLQQDGRANVGVFVGVTTNTYLLFGPEEWRKGNVVFPNSFPWSIANRVSYAFNLHGPSMPIDTACSSSLTAIHLACESLRRGECQTAIAGGVNLYLHPSRYVALCHMRMLSPTGKCHSFGADGDGFVPGEGVGAVLLKPLRQAVADGDNIYGVIKGSALNHGGNTNGYTVPSPKAQADLITDSLRQANVDARTITYLEAHGTGTSLGDPIEVNGLTKAFREHTDDLQFCAVGSAKSNIGHLESAAGIAGLTKVILQMKHGRLAPSLHAERLNPNVEFEKSPFFVQRTSSDWVRQTVVSNGVERELPRRAGISSFGAGGANAHLIVEEYMPAAVEDRPFREQESHLILLSAKDEQRLKEYAWKLALHIARDPQIELADVAYTLQVAREAMEERFAAVVTSKEQLLDALRAYRTGEAAECPLYRGNVREGARTTELDVATLWQQKDWAELARWWANGGNLDRSVLKGRPAVRRVVLPTYPFSKERYWIQIAEEQAASGAGSRRLNALHPMIDANVSTLDEQSFQKELSQDDAYVRDHLVDGQMVMPGAAYLEMARAAGELAQPKREGVCKLNKIVWAAPVRLTEATKNLQVSLYPQGDEVEYEIRSTAEEGDDLHASGALVWADRASLQQIAPLQIAEIRSRCPEVQSGKSFYQEFASLGFQYGASLQAVQEIFRNGTEVLARLELPTAADSMDDCRLHPALLDGAFQTVVALMDKSEAQSGLFYLPVALEELVFLRPLSPVMYAHVRQVEATGQLKKFAISLCDETGAVAVNVRDFSLKAFHRAQADAHQSIYMHTAWEALAAELPTLKQTTSGPLLLFDRGTELRDELLKRPDLSGVPVVLVRPGNSFQVVDRHTCEICPQAAEDYHQLFEHLKRSDLLPDRILHNWSPDRLMSAEPAELQDELDFGIYSCLFLSQALIDHFLTTEVRFLYACSLGVPHEAAVASFLKTLQQEQPNLLIKTLELAAEEKRAERLADIALWAWADRDAQTAELRFDQGVCSVKRLKLREADAVPAQADWLKEGGVYLITGGAGGLGLLFAQHLVEQARIKLVLTGRSALNAEQTERIRQLQSCGADVLYVQADVSRREDVGQLVQDAKRRFGRIDGVLHAAGLLRDALVRNKRKQEVEEILAAKLFGTLHLQEALQAEDLDVFVLFSSAAAVVGNAGQSDYAYANGFLDRFAEWRQASGHAGRTISFNWPLWQEGGMQVSAEQVSFLARANGMIPLRTESGMRAFAAGMVSSSTNWMVLEGDVGQIKRALRLEEARLSIAPQAQTAATAEVPTEELRAKTESFLKDVLAKELKLPSAKLHSRQGLDEYGLDSLMITSLTRELEALVGELTKTLFFEYQTIEQLTDYFLAHHQQRMIELTGVGALPQATTPAVREASLPSAKEQAVTRRQRERFNQRPTAPAARAASVRQEDIAIIGVSGRYPQAGNLEQFWEQLKSGKDCITEIPLERWDYRPLYDPDKTNRSKVYSKWGGFLDDVDKFDPLHFNISPKEAEVMDPQERLFLETAWHVVEDAGYTRERMAPFKVGVFVGVMYGHYQLYGAEETLKGNLLALNSSYASIANRVSYAFDLHGPSLAIDTMCSSSLTSIHLACESLYRGESEMAIAGGVNLTVHANKYTLLSQGRFAASDGRCRSFGEGGDGYVPGEGVGAVLLKPLSKAIADGDQIYAVIKATAINHGGKTNGYTVPNPKAQGDLISEALEKAQIDPRTISYLEAHGTGTSLGDPIEINGLIRAYSKHTQDKGYCAIGSVKSNIGHLESAAGIAGLTKVLLQLKHRLLVPSLHSETLNPNISFEQSPFSVQRELSEWRQPTVLIEGRAVRIPRRAGISAFGAGGSNAHLILEEFAQPAADERSQDAGEQQLIVLSARNAERLAASAEQLLSFLTREDETIETVVTPAPASERSPVREEVVALVAATLNVPADSLEQEEAWSEYGVDRMVLTELAEQIGRLIGVELSAAWYQEHRTLRALADYLAAQTRAEAEPIRKQVRLNASDALSLRDLAHTLQVGREAMEERLAFLARDFTELKNSLQAFLQAGNSPEFYRGHVRMKEQQVGVLVDGREGEEFLKVVMQERKLSKLAHLWTSGVEIDWSLLPPAGSIAPKRISLPLYPFAKERYWVPGAKPAAVFTSQSAAALHPLLGTNVSTLRAQKFVTKLTGDEFFVRDHQVEGERLLPGVAVLEAARAAGEIAGEAAVCRLLDTVWIRPIRFVEQEQEMYIHLYANGDQIDFEVSTIAPGRDHTLHARGQLELEKPNSPQAESIDVQTIADRCRKRVSSSDCYREFADLGFQYGPSFQPLQSVALGTAEALASWKLPSELEHDFQSFQLHPSVMDGALQAVMALMIGMRGDEQAIYLPYSLGEVSIFSELAKDGYAHVVMTEDDQQSGLKRFDVLLTDAAGRVAVQLKRFTVRKTQAAAVGELEDQELLALLKKLEAGELNADEVELLTEGSI